MLGSLVWVLRQKLFLIYGLCGHYYFCSYNESCVNKFIDITHTWLLGRIFQDCVAICLFAALKYVKIFIHQHNPLLETYTNTTTLVTVSINWRDHKLNRHTLFTRECTFMDPFQTCNFGCCLVVDETWFQLIQSDELLTACFPGAVWGHNDQSQLPLSDHFCSDQYREGKGLTGKG